MRPAFISLVGTSSETDELHRQLETRLPRIFLDLKCAFLGDPFRDYENLKIGDKHKRDYSPCARTLFRWGLFFEFNNAVVRPKFADDTDILLVRRFGFDLYAGAVAYTDCDVSLAIHQTLVGRGVTGLGIRPPLYVFTESTGTRLEEHRKKYFLHPGQRYEAIDPSLALEEKLKGVIDLYRHELAAGGRASAAA